MSDKKTHIAIALDSSGSMSFGGKKEAAIAAFNEQVKTIQENAEKGGDTFVSLILFGHAMNTVEVIKDRVPAEDLDELTEEDYTPTANTPFRDAIGLAIATLEAEDDPEEDVSFLVVTISDGLENASREWGPQTLANKVHELQDTDRWSFVTLVGEGIDMTEVDNLGLPLGNIGQFKNNAQGLRGASLTMSAGTESYLSAREKGETKVSNYVDPQ